MPADTNSGNHRMKALWHAPNGVVEVVKVNYATFYSMAEYADGVSFEHHIPGAMDFILGSRPLWREFYLRLARLHLFMYLCQQREEAPSLRHLCISTIMDGQRTPHCKRLRQIMRRAMSDSRHRSPFDQPGQLYFDINTEMGLL